MLRYKFRLGARVEVHANSCIYRGELKGASDTELFLKTPLKTWSFAMENIRSLKYLDDLELKKAPPEEAPSSENSTTTSSEFVEKTDPGLD